MSNFIHNELLVVLKELQNSECQLSKLTTHLCPNVKRSYLDFGNFSATFPVYIHIHSTDM